MIPRAYVGDTTTLTPSSHLFFFFLHLISCSLSLKLNRGCLANGFPIFAIFAIFAESRPAVKSRT